MCHACAVVDVFRLIPSGTVDRRPAIYSFDASSWARYGCFSAIVDDATDRDGASLQAQVYFFRVTKAIILEFVLIFASSKRANLRVHIFAVSCHIMGRYAITRTCSMAQSPGRRLSTALTFGKTPERYEYLEDTRTSEFIIMNFAGLPPNVAVVMSGRSEGKQTRPLDPAVTSTHAGQ